MAGTSPAASPRADHQRQRIVHKPRLRSRDVDRSRLARREGDLPDVAHHADDGVPRSVSRANVNTPANGILTGELILGQRFTDQRRQRSAGHVAGVKQAAAAQRDADRFEVARTHRISKRLLTYVRIVTLEAHTILVIVAAERQLAGERRRGDAGNVAYRL